MPSILTASDLKAAGVAFVVPVNAPVFLDYLSIPGESREVVLRPLGRNTVSQLVEALEGRAREDNLGRVSRTHRRPIFAYEPSPKYLAEVKAFRGLNPGVMARVAFGYPINLLERIALETAWAEAQDLEPPTPASPEGSAHGT